LQTDQPAWIVYHNDRYGLAPSRENGLVKSNNNAIPVIGFLAPCPPKNLGDPLFKKELGLKYAYYSGSMANGIASVELVETMAKNGCLGFFGSAGLGLDEVKAAIDSLQQRLADLPFGFNLINSINEPELEEALIDLYIDCNISLIEAAAYMDLTLPLVNYRVHGIHRDGSGKIITPNRIIAKVSRQEVAEKFFSPPPGAYLDNLVESGRITAEQAKLASRIPMAQDVTAEADSGGHTDNRPAITLLPTLQSLRDRLQKKYDYNVKLRVGLAGGVSTPISAAAAFAMGAAYVVTGSVNQACIESGTSDLVRKMLSETRQADIAMAPAADMFEMGVNVQVLKRGTMFSMRAAKLYELYQKYDGIHQIPEDIKAKIEKTIFLSTLDDVWEQTRLFFMQRDPSRAARAETDPKHKMALVFRSYLGQASIWANKGEQSRRIDFQIWCGPAMGAFNEWVRDSHLDAPANRKAADVALNILYGAAVLTRCNQLSNQNIPLPPDITDFAPRTVDELRSFQS